MTKEAFLEQLEDAANDERFEDLVALLNRYGAEFDYSPFELDRLEACCGALSLAGFAASQQLTSAQAA
jgi:hypothetical protein